MGFLDATTIGLGAIVGGGIFALSGVAFAATGPGAILAFALNGLIALLTVVSFAELSSTFPESGGPYVFAKRLLSVEGAFGVGWIVLFASIVASALYALGFAAYLLLAVERLWPAADGAAPAWLTSRWTAAALAIAATGAYARELSYPGANQGGYLATYGKLVLLAALILAGASQLVTREPAAVAATLHPFLSAGGAGLVLAMGYTFIALQGFDLIAAMGGEIKNPGRTIPRAMGASVLATLVFYLPLLFVVATLGGRPGESIQQLSAAAPETAFAHAVENFLGPPGYWLVAAAAVLAMLSALRANLLAASRIALGMGRDRLLPARFGRLHGGEGGAPRTAIALVAGGTTLLLIAIPDVAAAGSAASLIFLITFALVHWLSTVARARVGERDGVFRAPLFPLFPVLGGLACAALAIFQGLAVPVAGAVAVVWLGIGFLLYLVSFSRRARIVDARAQGADPELLRQRGLSPLVLVPIANPASAGALVTVANAITVPGAGRAMLLSVVRAGDDFQAEDRSRQLAYAQEVLGEALTASFSLGFKPEALTTIADDPWREIDRVAGEHRCESIVLGMSQISDKLEGTALDDLLSAVNRDFVILRAARGWTAKRVRRVLVPLGRGGDHEVLRARLLGNLARTAGVRITFLAVLPEDSSVREVQRARKQLKRIASDEAPGRFDVVVEQAADVSRTLIDWVSRSDLTVLGLQRTSEKTRIFGKLVVEIARATERPLLLISRGSP